MVTINQITNFSDKIARQFHPDRVILFGSHAYGTATGDSDVDLLVIMEHEGKGWQMATKIRNKTNPQFPMDLIVRTEKQIQKRLQMGDCFFKEITNKGKVLYEASNE
jgi:predicted nucleotidyltransferase